MRAVSWSIRAVALSALVLAGSAWAGAALGQAPVLVKMATLVPEGSSWHRILKETAAKWEALSGGRVKVVLYAGGVAGDDPDVVRKMRLGTLQAGVLTAVGVAQVDKSVYALGVPLMYDSYEELYGVLDKLRPKLEANLEAKGFVVLNWADGGWVRFFTKRPAATPDDLRHQKLFTWAGDNDSLEVWKAAGFQPVPLAATDIMTGLQTGLIEALGTPPQVAVISQYFNHAPNMTDLRWQLLLGATIINKATWERIPADLRPQLLEASREAGTRLQAEIRGSEQRDIDAMRKRGVNVVPVSAAQRAQWQQLSTTIYPKVRGVIVPADAFDDALRFRDEWRKAHAGGGTARPTAKPGGGR